MVPKIAVKIKLFYNRIHLKFYILFNNKNSKFNIYKNIFKINLILNKFFSLAKCKDPNLMIGEECTCIYPYYFDIAQNDQNCIGCKEQYWINKDINSCARCSNPKCKMCIDSSDECCIDIFFKYNTHIFYLIF